MSVLTVLRSLLLAISMAAVLSRVQTHAEATVAETAAASPTPAQAVSATTAVAPQNDSWVLPKDCHVWAHFEPGSWREIEITTETFDEHGKVVGRSVTTQKEVLKAVGDDNYIIEVQATVDVAGKRIVGPLNTRVLRLSTDKPGAIFSTARRENELLPLNAGAIECRVFEVQYADESHILSDLVYFSEEVFPHVLQRVTSERSPDATSPRSSEDVTSVLALKVPMEWEGRIIDCVAHQVVRHREKGKSQTLTWLSSEIPGGEIRSHSTDFDTSGKRIRWSIQRLTAYGMTHTTVDGNADVTSAPTGNDKE